MECIPCSSSYPWLLFYYFCPFCSGSLNSFLYSFVLTRSCLKSFVKWGRVYINKWKWMLNTQRFNYPHLVFFCINHLGGRWDLWTFLQAVKTVSGWGGFSGTLLLSYLWDQFLLPSEQEIKNWGQSPFSGAAAHLDHRVSLGNVLPWDCSLK